MYHKTNVQLEISYKNFISHSALDIFSITVHVVQSLIRYRKEPINGACKDCWRYSLKYCII